MAGTFAGINTALRGLMAQQTALQTTAHNVANANTEGFSRQRVVTSAAEPFAMPAFNRPAGAGQLGTGVEVQEIQRLRDKFLDSQVRFEIRAMGQWTVRQDTLEQLETVFMEPSETGLSTILSQFWNSWQELSKNPQSSPVRTTVMETGRAMAEAFRHTAQQLQTIKDDLDRMLGLRVQEINTLANQLAALNGQIAAIKLSGQQPNDLMDRRDLLLDQLARLLDIEVTEMQAGVTEVSVGGQQLVIAKTGTAGVEVQFVAEESPDGVPVDVQRLVWSGGDSQQVIITDGEVQGIYLARQEVERYQADLDQLVGVLTDRINALHSEGYDLYGNGGVVEGAGSGLAFFAYYPGSGEQNGAANIYLNEAIEANVALIAAGSAIEGDNEPLRGDGSKALAIARLGTTPMEELDQATPDTFYQNFVARLGVSLQEAGRMTANQQVLVDQLANRRESITGVSLDEEMAMLIEYQHAYQAASKVIQVMDEILETVVNGLKR